MSEEKKNNPEQLPADDLNTTNEPNELPENEELHEENIEFEEVSALSEPSAKYSWEWFQWYYESNKQTINYVGGGLLLLIGLIIGYKYYWLPSKEAEAADEIFYAQSLFERDSFNLALKGGAMVRYSQGTKPMMGFEKIYEEYSYTKTGTLAAFYAGVCYMHLGKYEDAISYFEKYDLNDEIFQPLAYGNIGDSYVELNKLDEGIKYYLKAANEKINNFTTPLFLKKAAIVYEQQKNYKEALQLYERIKKEFSLSNEARDVEKYIARINTYITETSGK
ncbi:MAG: tetratricopeptide repeat protein [Bacteroidia bacterium]|nr:tetratricopeptide repeat protein [Bacteroidia bacterium]